ncbi:hypothetical protein CYMTET_13206 [Cymbomonas tetramitiformis]|uniref:Uncharacterized protein n=1 Tax=Cymbomonas tetramitiformis TaxID=36881 RepID=A0AAE0GIY9_9CHLO|nr:hypothetical protein CYMTET_13206 [Cymbomonas tetramitiformis]
MFCEQDRFFALRSVHVGLQVQVAYPNSTAAGARGIIEELLHWRLVELMAIALRNNLTVTASNFHTVWMQDARLFLNPEAHFQMAVRSTPRVLVCKKDGIYDGPNEANGEDCSLGPTAEVFPESRKSATDIHALTTKGLLHLSVFPGIELGGTDDPGSWVTQMRGRRVLSWATSYGKQGNLAYDPLSTRWLWAE